MVGLSRRGGGVRLFRCCFLKMIIGQVWVLLKCRTVCFFYLLCRFLLLGNCRASIRTKYRIDVDIFLAIF